jgi:dienelactone hydrolase
MTTRLICLLLVALALPKAASAETPATVYFASADGRTELVGYLFSPAERGPHPAIVMLHGRSGPYSTNVNEDCTLVARSVSSDCDATTLSRRHAMWGQYWAERGYVALLVDSFGPRGKAHGFGRFTHGDPDRDSVNEKTVRPLDAEGALAWLRTRDDIIAGNIFLQGCRTAAARSSTWSTGRACRPPASGPRSPSIRAAAAHRCSSGPSQRPCR